MMLVQLPNYLEKMNASFCPETNTREVKPVNTKIMNVLGENVDEYFVILNEKGRF